MPILKRTPEDFRVEELPLYAPSGQGEHAWLEIEKRERTTDEVADDLARALDVDAGEVGWAGRKDREGITRQWLSVRGATPERVSGLAGVGWHVRQAAAHHERLRLGELAANRFTLVVHEVDEATAASAGERLAAIVAHGMPNRFGAQRYGNTGDNAANGARLLRGEPVPGGRRLQRLYLSALQSAIFDEALRHRPAPPHVVLAGDLVLVESSGALLLAHEAGAATGTPSIAELQERVDRFEAHPTGPMIGHKMRSPRGATLERERAAAAAWGAPWATALPRLHGHLLPGGRRPLRVRVRDVSHAHASDAFELRFTLPPGGYATVLVEELFPGVEQASPHPGG